MNSRKKTPRTYRIRAVQSGRWWALQSDDAEGFFSQVRRLDQVETMAQEGIAFLNDLKADEVNVVLDEILLEDDRQNRLADEARTQRRAAEDAAAAAAESTALAAQALIDDGLTVRDAARVLGLSFQRVAQLTAK
jgi:hypothetical protein